MDAWHPITSFRINSRSWLIEGFWIWARRRYERMNPGEQFAEELLRLSERGEVSGVLDQRQSLHWRFDFSIIFLGQAGQDRSLRERPRPWCRPPHEAARGPDAAPDVRQGWLRSNAPDAEDGAPPGSRVPRNRPRQPLPSRRQRELSRRASDRTHSAAVGSTNCRGDLLTTWVAHPPMYDREVQNRYSSTINRP